LVAVSAGGDGVIGGFTPVAKTPTRDAESTIVRMEHEYVYSVVDRGDRGGAGGGADDAG
jgi:hypothetical protein